MQRGRHILPLRDQRFHALFTRSEEVLQLLENFVDAVNMQTDNYADSTPMFSSCLAFAFKHTILKLWQIFVGNDVDTPLPYTGHLDARGIAAHLAMVERVSTVTKCTIFPTT